MGALADAAGRLELARGLLRRMEDRSSAVRPAPESDGRVLPVAEPLDRLLPAGGLRRGPRSLSRPLRLPRPG